MITLNGHFGGNKDVIPIPLFRGHFKVRLDINIVLVVVVQDLGEPGGCKHHCEKLEIPEIQCKFLYVRKTSKHLVV